ncbi:MAG: thiamine-phosphate kinase [Candidatus Acidiferrales bacterium]
MHKEDQLVDKIARAVPSILGYGAPGALRLGIGDDSAILSPGSRNDWVLSCDAFLEGVHFLAKAHPPDSVGYKSLVRAASDLVAMGASPQYFLMTLALPAFRIGTWLDAFLAGMARAARYLGMRLIGGDTTKSGSVSISITVLGEVPRGRALTRSGARPGDLIYVTGKLGRAQLGLELVRAKLARRSGLRDVLRQHLYPRIPVKLGEWLARSQTATAMMDISDGLSTDLTRLGTASRVGARIEAQRVPCVSIPAGLLRGARKLKLNPLQMALHGGDDYGLLITVPRRRANRLQGAPDFSSLTCIGEITTSRRILLINDDGSATPLEAHGWDPFGRK